MTDRKATTVWTGDLARGKGEVSLDTSGAGAFTVSFPSRAQEANGQTSPEELIAAAHSSCYSMQLSGLLGANGTPPERIETNAVVTFGKKGEGFGILGIVLTARASVPGLAAEKFAELAETAKQICPVSAALTGTEITLDAALA
ncbi:OsmC family peroxiredoxin [Actinokineospora sp. NBRC 105648]|uniref:OsmC family peroxiredoxin n=1 Tax=Actinokineospora sp. NBRC 105648 TaxID=3032206 RepID=UPI0024A3EE0D|nr:OsmC family peroxiredoxin [Actinokineospora sp. NBRC 105648]GLZ41330.1 osmotically inducible protein OsmC [Actinokineospora sp. NBRC 105648]